MGEAIPQDKADLQERIQREWAVLEQVVNQLSEEQMKTPGAGGWSVKDNLAHLTAWEQFMLLYHLHGHPAHEVMRIDAATMDAVDENGLNDILYRRNRDRSVAEVLTDFRRSHQQVVAFLEQLPFADLMQPRYPDDPQARPLINWVIGNTYEHYEEHRLNIRARK